MKLAEIINLIYSNATRNKTIVITNRGEGDYVSYWDENVHGVQPPDRELLDKIPQLQAAFDNKQIDIRRRNDLPQIHELIVAMWEDVVEGRPEAKEALQAKRLAVKLKYPKA